MSGIPAWAVRGAKVVWTGGRIRPGVKRLTEGRVYTLRGTALCPINGHIGCYLVGVYNDRHLFLPEELGYLLEQFRPLVTAKTEAEDLAHFKHHLTQKSPELVE
jgi:hypothetical protein